MAIRALYEVRGIRALVRRRRLRALAESSQKPRVTIKTVAPQVEVSFRQPYAALSFRSLAAAAAYKRLTAEFLLASNSKNRYLRDDVVFVTDTVSIATSLDRGPIDTASTADTISVKLFERSISQLNAAPINTAPLGQ